MHCFNSNAIFLVIFDNMFENIDKQNTMDILWELISDCIFNYNLIKLTVNKNCGTNFLQFFRNENSYINPTFSITARPLQTPLTTVPKARGVLNKVLY